MMDNEELLRKIEPLLSNDKPFTMPIIYNKPYSENYISDWLAFILNPEINELENEQPLNILLSLAGKGKIKDNEYVDFSNPREVRLDDESRIDFLIPVYKNSKAKENHQSPLYYIAIENKIFAGEVKKKGKKPQTERYYDWVQDKKPNDNNIFIFLTPFGTKAEHHKFSNISYEKFIKHLNVAYESKRSKMSEKSRVYVSEFIEHMKEYILNKSFSENDCKLLEIGKDIETEYKNDKETKILSDAHQRLLELKSLFFQQLEKQIKENFKSDEWDSKIGDCYIQLYKKNWEKKEIHYEIVITNNINRRGGLYSGIPISLMIHAESYIDKDNENNRNELKKYLKNVFNDDMSFSNNYKCQLYEEKLYETIGTCFGTPANLNKFIRETVEQLRKLSVTATECIDNFIKDSGKHH